MSDWPGLCIFRAMDFSRYHHFMGIYKQGAIKKLMAFRRDVELTHPEKELFEIRLHLRNKEWERAEERLEKLKTENPFLKGERYAIFLSLKNSLAEYEEAAKFGQIAVRYYEEAECREGLFKAFYNLSVAFNRIGMDSLSDFYLIQAGKNAMTPNQKYALDRARVCALSKRCEFVEATRILDAVDHQSMEHMKFEIEQFKVVAIDVYFRAEKVEKAKSMIAEIMRVKKSRERGRALFYYHLINLWESGKMIPEKPNAVAELPEYSLKWDLINAILNGETDRVEELWQEIVIQFPNYFAENFECLNQSQSKTIFYTVLKKILVDCPDSQIDLSQIRGKKSRQLIEALMNAKTPVRKEELIESIWGEDYRPELDSRFYKLVERSRGLIPLQIKNNQNAYFLAG